MTWKEVVEKYRASKDEDKLWLDIKHMLGPASGGGRQEQIDKMLDEIYHLIRQNPDDPALSKKIDAIEYW